MRERCASLGVVGYREVTGNLDDPELPTKTGRFDLVHCSGIIYHCPNPVETMGRLYALTNKYLLLGSMTVPPTISTSAGDLTLEPGCCLLLPSLKGKTKAIVGEYFHSRNVRVHNITPYAKRAMVQQRAPILWPMVVALVRRDACGVGRGSKFSRARRR